MEQVEAPLPARKFTGFAPMLQKYLSNLNIYFYILYMKNTAHYARKGIFRILVTGGGFHERKIYGTETCQSC
jgi:hypothetical protein